MCGSYNVHVGVKVNYNAENGHKSMQDVSNHVYTGSARLMYAHTETAAF